MLSRGIDVYTAVNIQHIESLNDVVAQITHVRVRETVPDKMFDRADAIELIDLTPDDLIQRLKEGKVYVPKQAERALEHYFSPGNLTALRELALRRTAERVDEQLLTHMQANAIAGPWAAGERILMCLSEDPRAAGLVRYTKRLADRLHAPWTAVTIETRRSLQLTDGPRDRLADTMRLAESLGGESITIPGVGRRIADDVVQFAHANNVTQIIISKSTRPWWFELMRGSVVHDLVRHAGNISVNVIAGEELAAEPVPKKTVRNAERSKPFDPKPYLMALLVVAVGLAPASRPRCATISSSCRRSTPSRSPNRPTSPIRVVLLLPEDGVLTVKSGYPPEDELDRADLAAANWTWSNDRPAGRGSDTLPGAKRLFLPMRTGRGLIGVIGTLVDCVERPDLAAGTEELSNALQTVRALDVTKLVELTTARENQSLAGILGCWLESRREDLFVDDEMLKDLKRSVPSSPRAVLGTTSQAGEAHPEWNVVLPSEFLHPSFEGGSPEMAP